MHLRSAHETRSVQPTRCPDVPLHECAQLGKITHVALVLLFVSVLRNHVAQVGEVGQLRVLVRWCVGACGCAGIRCLEARAASICNNEALEHVHRVCTDRAPVHEVEPGRL